MKWNWEQKDWPKFRYKKEEITKLEHEFLYSSGKLFGVYTHLQEQEQKKLYIELITSEALKTSEIEGKILNRDSLQSSIKRNFGLTSDQKKIPAAEKGISDMMTDLYHNFDDKLSHSALFRWHKMLMNGRSDLKIGKYRTDEDAMQIVSGRLDEPKIHFEAPPSKQVKDEMDEFIAWFNDSKTSMPPLSRAAIAHLYFVSIHPFEDGNGRISRALAIKALSQSIQQPILTSLSTIIQSERKKYYQALEDNNRNLEITNWLIYFGETFLKSQNHSQKLIEFLLTKAKFFEKFKGQINERQEKVLTKIFAAGIDGFEGGLSAENYIAITKTSRATATRDLQDLLDKGTLSKKGELKGTRYFLKL